MSHRPNPRSSPPCPVPATKLAVALWSCLSLAAMAGTATPDEEDLAQIYGGKGFVSIATGSVQPVTRAPAVATVITAADIEAIGARTVEDALVMVPGLHVSRSSYFYNSIYSFRGIDTQFNPQVLVLVNDVPLTSVLLGDRGSGSGTIPVELISRIEVMRGPGSALYGADALTGVINIITKSPEELKGSRLYGSYGTYQTGELIASHGVAEGPVQYVGYVRVGKTDGPDETIRADRQTGLDHLFGTSASKAPGPLNLGMEGVDAGVDMRFEDFTLRANYKRRTDVGTAVGVASALDPKGNGWGDRLGLDFGWRNNKLANDWDLSLRATYTHTNEHSKLILFPPGVAFPPISTFSDGILGNVATWQRQSILSGAAIYSGITDHRLRFGAGYQKSDLYRVEESKNYTFVPVPGFGSIPVPLGGMVDMSGNQAFIEPHIRTNRYVYGQDEWSLAPDWVLTAGVRHDRYSDFGGTTNPRAALVWEAAYNVTAKLIYGTGFRPPSFAELYNINNPVAVGNPNLKPETIKSTEAAVNWQVTPNLSVGANVYDFTMRDILRFDSTTGIAENAGELKGQGFELEFAWDATRQLRLSGNYSQQRTWDPETGKDPGYAPRHRAYGRADWRFMPGWSLNTQVNWVADRRRESGDPRGPIEDYTLVDLALRTEGKGRQWALTLAVHNLFDVDAREPSPLTSPFVYIPNDLPLPGRQITVIGNIGF
jgi:outer membrane receptor protein involved in Fe transport